MSHGPVQQLRFLGGQFRKNGMSGVTWVSKMNGKRFLATLRAKYALEIGGTSSILDLLRCGTRIFIFLLRYLATFFIFAPSAKIGYRGHNSFSISDRLFFPVHFSQREYLRKVMEIS